MHMMPDNPCEASPSGPTIHAKPARQARQSMSGTTGHAKPSQLGPTIPVMPDNKQKGT